MIQAYIQRLYDFKNRKFRNWLEEEGTGLTSPRVAKKSTVALQTNKLVNS